MSREEMKMFFDYIITEGAFFEVRILKTDKGTISGYFDDPEILLRAIKPYDGKYNIFFTLNTVLPDVICRSKNHFTKWAKNTTTDKEIVQRDWILIDLDPERPAGISSTEEELSCAEKLAEKIEKFLIEQGFSEPVKCLSGNGYHLLYPVLLENTPENNTLVKDFLTGMDCCFSNEFVKVDTSTFNAARITKLYGTMACKGDNIETRPHRRSCVVSAPSSLEKISAEQIKGIIALCKQKGKENERNNSSVNNKNCNKIVPYIHSKKINVKEFCEAHEIEVADEKKWCNGICYVLARCPWNPEHIDRSAYIIEYPNGKITAGCHHDSCSGENWRTLLKQFPDMEEYMKPIKREMVKKDDSMSASEVLLTDIKEVGHQFYRDAGNIAYVSVPLENGHIEYMAMQDKRYKQLLQRMYYQKYGKALSREARQQVMDTIEAEAIFSGAKIEPAVRCKYYHNQVFYYIGDDEQTVIRIDKKDIRVLEECSIPFIRKHNMLEQVIPMDREVKEGEKKPSFRKLARKYWRFQSEEDLLLHNVTLLSRFVSDIPCPIMYYRGDRGSAKTTSMRLDQLFLDPSNTDVRALPSSVSDIISILFGSYSVAFDNIEGGISSDLANIFCICVTSGYYSKRKLYTDNDNADFYLHTHLSFSGITTISHRADLLDRCICLSAKRIPDSERKTEDAILSEFKKDLPYLLYRGMKILSKALEIFEQLELPELPRMGDFAKLGYAIAEAMKYGGNRFLDAYKRNQEEILEVCAEEDGLLALIVSFMKEYDFFHGTMTELQGVLIKHAQKVGVDGRYIMKTSNALSRKLYQAQSVLEMLDIHLKRGKSNGDRYIEIWRGENTQCTK